MAEVSDATIERFYVDVGRRIRDARTRVGVTQAQLAGLSQMTRSSVANVEAGRQRIPLHVLALIASALRVEPLALFDAESLSDDSEVGSVPLELEGEPDTTREFIEGAIAQLGIATRREAE